MSWCRRYNYQYSSYISQINQARKYNLNPREVISTIQTSHRYKIPLVDILAWVLMSNHFHLILKENIENGLQTFMHRLCTGYAMYFNRKYNFSGALFQGRYKSVSVEYERQLLNLFRYVHVNPVVAHITTLDKIFEYPWSSLRFFIGKKDPFDLINPDYFLNLFSDQTEVRHIIRSSFDVTSISSLEGLVIDDDLNWFT
jgi:putative transposase